MLRNIARHILCALALLTTFAACHADTLQLMSTSGGSVNGVDIYPYNFSVDGSSQLTSLACLNFNREVTVGEKWQVAIHGLGMTMSQTDIDYRADALLYSDFGKPGDSNSNVQFAIWSIFDPAVTSNSGFTAAAQALAKVALQQAVDPTLMNSGFFQKFALYTPTSNQAGWTSGIPQEFIGTAVTPEPSSLVLFGTGALCTGLLCFSKRQIAANSLSC